MKRSPPFYLILAVILTGACETVSYNKLDTAVDRDLVLFSRNEIPGELETMLESKQMVLLGEPNYVEEHHQYISMLLDRFGGEGLCFINEFSNAYNWMVEDYIRGEREHLPYTIRLLNHTWLEKIREINLAHEGDGPVSFHLMDVNQWKEDFKTSIEESEKILGEQSIFALIKILAVDRNAYLYELEDLKEMLEKEPVLYKEQWGEKWYRRYQELIGGELESCRYRMSPDESARELFMYEYIQSASSVNPHRKVIINCGLHHAQKETFMGAEIQRLRAMLEEEHAPGITSIAFAGIKGKRKYKFNSEEVISFNVLDNPNEKNLMFMIGQKAGNQMSMLLLHPEIYSKEMDVSYSGGAVRVAPGRQFDALITYPEISILNSLSDFNY